jgi:hypothetical protein
MHDALSMPCCIYMTSNNMLGSRNRTTTAVTQLHACLYNLEAFMPCTMIYIATAISHDNSNTSTTMPFLQSAVESTICTKEL